MDTILLIENDPTNLLARSLVLRCFGYAVLEADSRGEAWSVCGDHWMRPWLPICLGVITILR